MRPHRKNSGLDINIMGYYSLTNLQRAVVRLRKNGWKQQEIAYLTGTTVANICAMEKTAWANIERAKLTLMTYYELDAKWLCTLKPGSDIFTMIREIPDETAKHDIPVTTDPVEFITRIRRERPHAVRGRRILEEIEIFLRNDGKLDFF